ncbi:hypothetical protein, partial [Chitiniphilus shinanonensis]
MISRAAWQALLVLCLGLAGCQRGNAEDASALVAEASAPALGAETFMASSHGINYDHEFGIDYTLRWAGDAKGEAIGSGSVGP